MDILQNHASKPDRQSISLLLLHRHMRHACPHAVCERVCMCVRMCVCVCVMCVRMCVFYACV